MGFSVGDLVEVYCRYCPWRSNDKFMVAPNLACGTQSPRIARSDGWAKAVIVEISDKNPLQSILPQKSELQSTGLWVRTKFLEPVWVDSKGQVLEEKSLFQWLSAEGGNLRLLNPSYVPEVSLVAVRWGGSVPVDERRFDFALSDKLIQELLETVLTKNIEVFTIYIEHSSELSKVSHLHLFHCLRGKIKIGMYFLWGSNNDSKPGYVIASDLIHLMERLESVGVVTKYPNHSSLYRAITSKEYQSTLCVCPHLKIPPTVSVPVSLILSSLDSAVINILKSLQTIKMHVQKSDAPITNGVVKVGNEWMGDGVRAFSGVEDLKAKLLAMLDGAHGPVKSILIQERIPSLVCEPRVFVFNGKVRGIRYTWNQKQDLKSGRIHALRTCPQNRAAEELFQGDVAAQKFVERKIASLVNEWNVWLLTIGGEIPLFVRMDFLVESLGGSHQPGTEGGEDAWNYFDDGENGKADPILLPSPEPHADDVKYQDLFRVWTCELGEMGSSMVGFREGKSMLFDAVASSCACPVVLKRPARAAPKLS